MKLALRITMLDENNNQIRENIGYINPNATDKQMRELAIKLCNLTSNTFVTADKITTVELESGENDG